MTDWSDVEGVPEAIEEDEHRKSVLHGYGLIFEQLLASERFKELFQLYFTLTKIVDDSAKTVYFEVIENPPEIIAQKMTKAASEESSKIQVVDESKAKKIIEKATKRK